jgi:hypothetical protein
MHSGRFAIFCLYRNGNRAHGAGGGRSGTKPGRGAPGPRCSSWKRTPDGAGASMRGDLTPGHASGGLATEKMSRLDLFMNPQGVARVGHIDEWH